MYILPGISRSEWRKTDKLSELKNKILTEYFKVFYHSSFRNLVVDFDLKPVHFFISSASLFKLDIVFADYRFKVSLFLVIKVKLTKIEKYFLWLLFNITLGALKAFTKMWVLLFIAYHYFCVFFSTVISQFLDATRFTLPCINTIRN